ncbi:hypothetical protein [Halorientalis persicus]|uniref:hypothetical protein n=1 Tax=Halorientalis persicus TaxID=1367881 RepID=UPI000B85F9C6|nr:hypothetical protein [Halorientalis persicus]
MTNDEDRDAILDQLPPEKLLSATNPELIRAGIRCMDSLSTVREYVAYENTHEARTGILGQLRMRARELRQQD